MAETILKNKITEDMTVEEVVSSYPETIDILLSKGVHCIGCHASTFEAIGDGLRGHGLTEEEVTETIKELNAAVEESADEEISLSAQAAMKVKELQKEHSKESHGLRITVNCCGDEENTYDFGFEERPKETDKIVESKSIKMFLNKRDYLRMKGSKIDYVNTEYEE